MLIGWAAAILVAVIGLGYVGHLWRGSIALERIVIASADFTEPDEIQRLAGISGDTLLFQMMDDDSQANTLFIKTAKLVRKSNLLDLSTLALEGRYDVKTAEHAVEEEQSSD